MRLRERIACLELWMQSRVLPILISSIFIILTVTILLSYEVVLPWIERLGLRFDHLLGRHELIASLSKLAEVLV